MSEVFTADLISKLEYFSCQFHVSECHFIYSVQGVLSIPDMELKSGVRLPLQIFLMASSSTTDLINILLPT